MCVRGTRAWCGYCINLILLYKFFRFTLINNFHSDANTLFYFTYFYLAIKSIYEARLRDYIYKFTTSRRSLFNLFYDISWEEREREFVRTVTTYYKKWVYYQ